MDGPFLLLLVLAATSVLHIVSMAAAGVLAGVALQEVAFGIGPTIVSREVRGAKLSLKAIPMGGFAKFADEHTADVPPDAVLFSSRPFMVRAAIQLSGCAVLVGCAMLALGPQRGLAETLMGFGQIVLGTVSPSRAVSLIEAATALAAAEGALAVFGVLAAKVAAFNLLPIPLLNGGSVLVDAAESAKLIGDRGLAAAQWVGLLLAFVLMGAWVIALVRVLL